MLCRTTVLHLRSGFLSSFLLRQGGKACGINFVTPSFVEYHFIAYSYSIFVSFIGKAIEYNFIYE